MMSEGRQIFRFDTFGSEAVWGNALQLHKAIAGEKNGGVGGGVSPKTALSVGLKVDTAAVPDALVVQIKAGERHWHGAKADTTMAHITITTVGSHATWG